MARILVITSHYLPGYKAGGPVRSLANMAEWLGDDFQIYIATSDRDLEDIRPYPGVKSRTWQSVGKARVFYLSPGEMGFLSLRHLLRTFSYDLLYLNSFFAPLTRKILLLRRMGQVPEKPIVLAPRGEFSTGALMIKRLKKCLYISWVKRIGLVDDIFWQASSDYEKQDILTVFGHQTKDNHLLIHVASNLPPKLNSQLKPSHRLVKQVNSAHMVFLSRIARKKNLDFALNLLTNVGGAVLLDIYGPIEDQRYWQECQVLIDRLPSNVEVKYRGSVSHDQVVEVFSHYHLFLFPTRGENFGRVILEALSTGCLVLTSDQTPWRNLAAKKVGWDLPLSEPEWFNTALSEVISMDDLTFERWSRSTRRYEEEIVKNPTLVQDNRELFTRALQGKCGDPTPISKICSRT